MSLLAQLLEQDLHHGQEIYTFFNKYGGYGLIGLIMSIALISIIIYKTFKSVLENKINSYQDLLIEIPLYYLVWS